MTHHTRTRIRHTAGTLTALAIMVAVFLIGDPTPAGASSPADVAVSTVHGTDAASVYPYVTPCAVEDGTGCYWQADTAGNGTGASFTAVPVTPGAVCVLFWSGHGDYCERDAYAPAGVPVWQQMSGTDARAMASTGAGTVGYWATCAVSYGRELTRVICPDGYAYADRT